MRKRIAVFFADGLCDDNETLRFRDHFALGVDEKTHKSFWNFVLARGWESALVASGKHVALVMPVPSNDSYGAAAKVLPALLSDIYAVLVAIGDIAAPAGSRIGRPQLGIAAHSAGGRTLFPVVDRYPKAFQEIWLFEAKETPDKLSVLEKAAQARVLFAGFERAFVGAYRNAKGRKSLAGRVRPLPDPPLDKALPATLVASSTKLKHALEGKAGGKGMVDPKVGWDPDDKRRERFEVLHQHIVQGNDADGLHYLTKALLTSTFS